MLLITALAQLLYWQNPFTRVANIWNFQVSEFLYFIFSSTFGLFESDKVDVIHVVHQLWKGVQFSHLNNIFEKSGQIFSDHEYILLLAISIWPCSQVIMRSGNTQVTHHVGVPSCPKFVFFVDNDIWLTLSTIPSHLHFILNSESWQVIFFLFTHLPTLDHR